MSQDRYHVLVGKKRTTVSLDQTSSNMLALKLGEEPRTEAARAAIRAYLQKKLDENNDPHRSRVSQWLREWILLDLVDKKLSTKYWAWFQGWVEATYGKKRKKR